MGDMQLQNTSMVLVMVSKLGCDISVGLVMGPKVFCAANPARNMYICISEFLILFHPTPVCERGGSQFQGRQTVHKETFDNNFRAWLGLDTLETPGTHPPIAKYGTKKQLAKHLSSLDWIKYYMTILGELKQESGLRAQRK